uniref:PlsC domain-containing protein n=1 Tax=Rhabditophanes sp. KR3021 TaxID=114890 RepID=A0AC35U7K0_9BILA
MDASSTKLLRGHEYVNILDVLRKNGGELNWARKSKDFAKNEKILQNGQLNTKETIQKIMKSQVIKNTIEEISKETQQDINELKKEGYATLWNMAQNFQISMVKLLGYSCLKVLNNVLEGVFINKKQFDQLKEAIREHPVIFMPSHKSYLDFILLSVICYDQELTLPSIAAGMDFQNSFFIGESLRKCGAFFLKRSFGQDKLYWVLFSEYVQIQITHPDRPIEYFVEGTRSRTQKSLFPKYGLLQMVLEPFLKSKVFDTLVVPVTINYDRVMEEALYGYELLGFPKPKESTSSLFKARSILQERYGNVYVTFGETISTRSFFNSKIDRIKISQQPINNIQFDDAVRDTIKEFAHSIITIHNTNSIVTVWPVIAFSILTLHNSNSLLLIEGNSTCLSRQVLKVSLINKVKSFINLLTKLKINLEFFESNIEVEIERHLLLHNNLFAHSGEKYIEIGKFKIEESKAASAFISEVAVTTIILQNYTNQILHYVVNNSFVALSIMKNKNQNIELTELYCDYVMLKSVFRYEFVHVHSHFSMDFEKSINDLISIGCIKREGDTIKMTNPSTLEQISSFLNNFVNGYVYVMDTIKQMGGYELTQENVIAACQLQMAKDILNKKYFYVQNLSTDFLKNVLATLFHQKALVKSSTGNDSNVINIDSDLIHKLTLSLKHFLHKDLTLSFFTKSLTSKL